MVRIRAILAFWALLMWGCSDRWGSTPEDVEASSSSQALPQSISSSDGEYFSSSLTSGVSTSQPECPNLESDHRLTDCRDNQVYTIDTLGSQIWMTQNLRHSPNIGESWCYADSVSNCTTKGRLYDWPAASTSCPFGWHLPDTTEWLKLIETVGGHAQAGANLRFPNSFSAKPAGYTFGGGYFAGTENTYWWSSVEYEQEYARYFFIKQGSDTLYSDGHFQDNGFSVRCMKDLPSSSSGSNGSSGNSSSSFYCGADYLGIELGTFIDKRDQQEYATVRICKQEWFAENLNYTANNSLGICLDEEKCNESWGRWYKWSEIMGGGWPEMNVTVAIEQVFPGICPEGWHLPDNSDLDALFQYVFHEQEPEALSTALANRDEATLYLGAAKYLKAIVPGLDLWDASTNNAGDPFHFGILPTGGIWSAAESLGRESEAALWYISKLQAGGNGGQEVVYQATGMRLRDESPILDHFWGTGEHALPVRCLR